MRWGLFANQPLDFLAEFLSRSGYARDESFWTVAQALSEILPQGDTVTKWVFLVQWQVEILGE